MKNMIKPLEGLTVNERSMPDPFIHHQSKFLEPDSSYVISRDKNGNILSYYGDNSWDFDSYKSSPSQYAIINFDKNIQSETRIQEAKKLTFMLIIYGEGKRSSSYSIETLRAFFSKVIKPLSNYSADINTDISTLLSNDKLIFKYINKYCTNHDRITLFSSFLTLVDALDNRITGIDFHSNPEIFSYLLKLAKIQKGSRQQTEVIPSRIFSLSIKQRWEQIDEVYNNLQGLTSYLEQHLQSDLFGETKALHARRIQRGEKHYICFEDAVSIYKLNLIFEKYNVLKRHEISAFFRKIQGTCKHLIHAYTGMRDGEVQNLNMNCIDESNDKFFRIVSYTSKLEGKKLKESWATDRKIKKVIKILQAINRTVGDHYGYTEDSMPLFIRTSLFYANKEKRDFKNIDSIRFGSSHQLPLEEVSITITEADIDELYDIDYIRDWRNEQLFQVGKQWEFSFHQYRRTLAVYSIQSGQVSLGALQKQFKHTFREMTSYYGNGATFGKNHISKEINELRVEVEAMSYIKNVIFSDEKLFGSQGLLLEKGTRSSKFSKKGYLMENREKTIKRFKNGLMSYKETALGGCVSTEDCDLKLTRSFLPCIGCDSSILKKSKMQNVVLQQEKFIAQLDVKSVMFRSETADLQELKKQLKKLKDK